MDEETDDGEGRPEGAGEERRVILLTPPEGVAGQILARALAARGHSLVLWGGAAEARGGPEESILELQLALARAGGISLFVAGEALAQAGEAFGHIDVALALGADAADRVVAAAARLGRAHRPARLVVLMEAAAEFEEGAGVWAPGGPLPAGMRVFRQALPAGELTAETAGPVLERIWNCL